MMRQSEFKMKQGNLQDNIFTEKEKLKYLSRLVNKLFEN